MIDSSNKISVLKRANWVRKIVSDNLPIQNSLLREALLLEIGIACLEEKNLSIKQLLSEVPQSTMGKKYHLRELVDSNWIEIVSSTSDKRQKLIIPTEKFLCAIDQLCIKLITLTPDGKKSLANIN